MSGKLVSVELPALGDRAELGLLIRAIAKARGMDENSALGTGPLSDALKLLDEEAIAFRRASVAKAWTEDDLRRFPLELLGGVVQRLHADAGGRGSTRSKLGAFYTPRWLIWHVLNLTLEPLVAEVVANDPRSRGLEAILALRIADPACGSGDFLCGVVDRLSTHLVRADPTLDKAAAIGLVTTRCIFGVDRDPIAAQVCRCVLWLYARGAVDRAALDRSIVCADGLACVVPERAEPSTSALLDWTATFPTVFARAAPGFDVIVGNPPFLNQLRRSTARDARVAEAVCAWSSGVVTRYADAASAFLLLSTMLVREGGWVGLVQPLSTLVTADAQPIRAALAKRCTLSALWWSPKPVFDAHVRTCAIVLRRWQDTARASTTLERTMGPLALPASPIQIDRDALATAPTWAALIASDDLPIVTVRATHTLADFATATADFRDQYYGLRNCIVDDADLTPPQRTPPHAWPPIITSGLIDLGRHAWGQRSTRLLNQSWQAPRADSHALRRDRALAQWLDARLIPKVLLATQSRVLECVVDEHGELLPSVPVITLAPKPMQPTRHGGRPLWRIAAAVCSPVCCAVALRHFAGAALSLGAIKLSAKQTLTLPMPSNLEAWEAGAFAFRTLASLELKHPARRQALEHFASIMADAYGIPKAQRQPLSTWWLARRP